MREGFFAIHYTGKAGSGHGLMALSRGVIVGVDAAGGVYDGEYESEGDQAPLTGNLQLKVLAGVSLVTGPTVEHEVTLEIPLYLAGDFATSDKPTTVKTTFGAVNVLLKKLRDLPSA